MDLTKAQIINQIDLLLARDIGRLVKKQIIDKRGRKQTVWVRPEGMKKKIAKRPQAPSGYEKDAWNHFVDLVVKQKQMANSVFREKDKYNKLPSSTQKTVKEFHTKPVSVLAKQYYDATKRAADKGNPKAKEIWSKFRSGKEAERESAEASGQERLEDAMSGARSGDFDGKVVDDLSKVPSHYTGEVLEVNDHGNVTLYEYNQGKGKEIASRV